MSDVMAAKDASSNQDARSATEVPMNASRPYDWGRLLSTDRLPSSERNKDIYLQIDDHRTSHEKDFDRVVFCTPVRRMKDKTQVFPLDMHDGVRTRLTHSMEVSNLARSMGVAVAAKSVGIGACDGASRSVPALLAAIALVHDLGNPPFGHQGEVAIRTWVEANEVEIKREARKSYNRDLLKDFLLFEGNAQGFRILARLQHQDHRSGLRLTASTLRAFMKYPWMSDSVNPKSGKKKFGVFHSEKDVFHWSCEKTGLEPGARHPLSYLMEVCDDIAYSVLDIEDGVKKEIVSAAELAAFLSGSSDDDHRIKELLNQYSSDRKWLSSLRMPDAAGEGIPISSKELRDSLIDIFRSYAVGVLVSDAIEYFLELESRCDLGSMKKGIAEEFKSAGIVSSLKDFAALRIYKHPSVLKAELEGHRIIPRLMDSMWRAVVAHAHGTQSKVDEYVMSLMSPNYVRVYLQSRDLGLPDWYRQVQLVCDQVCGMTDSYAIRVHDELVRLGCL